MNYPKSISTLHLLYLCDDEFKDFIDKTRKKYNLNVDENVSFDAETYVQFDLLLINNQKLHRTYFKDIYVLCHRYDLEDYLEEMQMFVETGMTTFVSSDDSYRRLGGIKDTRISPRQVDTNTGVPGIGINVRFTIRKPISAKELKEWLDQHTDRILVAMNEHFRGYKKAVTRSNKLPRILRIIDLRKTTKKTYEEIADVLCEENPDDPDVIEGKINDQSVKMVYHRYTSQIK